MQLVGPILRNSHKRRFFEAKAQKTLGTLGHIGHPRVKQGWLPHVVDHDKANVSARGISLHPGLIDIALRENGGRGAFFEDPDSGLFYC